MVSGKGSCCRCEVVAHAGGTRDTRPLGPISVWLCIWRAVDQRSVSPQPGRAPILRQIKKRPVLFKWIVTPPRQHQPVPIPRLPTLFDFQVEQTRCHVATRGSGAFAVTWAREAGFHHLISCQGGPRSPGFKNHSQNAFVGLKLTEALPGCLKAGVEPWSTFCFPLTAAKCTRPGGRPAPQPGAWGGDRPSRAVTAAGHSGKLAAPPGAARRPLPPSPAPASTSFSTKGLDAGAST